MPPLKFTEVVTFFTIQEFPGSLAGSRSSIVTAVAQATAEAWVYSCMCLNLHMPAIGAAGGKKKKVLIKQIKVGERKYDNV